MPCCPYGNFEPRNANVEKGVPHCLREWRAFQMIQLGALPDPLFHVYGQVSAQVRKICTKQNLINPCYIAQHAKHGIACRKSRIPIDATKDVSRSAPLLSACDEPLHTLVIVLIAFA